MKVKALPGDFRVEEVSDLEVAQSPQPYAVYRLSKTSWDTFDLLALLARRLGVRRADIAASGYKDRHGETTQLLTVRARQGMPRLVRQRNFTAERVGWSAEPARARAMRGNRFQIVLRDLDDREAARCLANLALIERQGIPNYYDEQRFGSARHRQGFMGKELFLGRREAALRLWFTPSKHDDRRTRELKRVVIEHWRRWSECPPAAGLQRTGEYGRVLAFLAEHPRAFRRALLLLDRRFLVFVLNAYQSYLFNEILAGLLRHKASKAGFELQELRYNVGTFVFPSELPETLEAELAALALPVPGYDTSVSDGEIRAMLDEVLHREGIGLAELQARQLPGVSVHGVPRAAWVHPTDLARGRADADERYAGKRKLTLSFVLPRGSYATLLVKRLGLGNSIAPDQSVAGRPSQLPHRRRA